MRNFYRMALWPNRLLLGTMLFLPLLALFVYGGSRGRPAVAAGCFPHEEIPNWLAGDIIVENEGASRPLPDDVVGEKELCSASAGIADAGDDYRYLIQRAEGDFQLDAAVINIDNIGFGGIAARYNERGLDGAHVRISVEVRSGLAYVGSSVRLDNGAAVGDGGTNLVAVSLPVSLQLTRSGNTFTTAYAANGNPFVDHLTVDATGHDLERDQLVVGLVQSSGDVATPASAVFERVLFDMPDTPPPDPQACFGVFPLALNGGDELELHGFNLDQITAVTVAGEPADILTSETMRTTIQTRATAQGIHSGPIVIGSLWNDRDLGVTALYAGEPYVRGDLNEDLNVDATDKTLLEHYLAGNLPDLGCPEAADINGDGLRNGNDVAYLQAYLDGGGSPPPAPFPSPGFAPGGGRTCGLPPVPRISGLSDKDGNPVSDTTTLAEGDRLLVVGANFPADPAQAALFFENVPTHVISGTTSQLTVQIGPVPDGGNKCPALLNDSDSSPLPSHVQNSGDGLSYNRRGLAYAVRPDGVRPDLCPNFAPSTDLNATIATYNTADHSLFLSFPKSVWDPSWRVRVELRYYMPLLDGASHGSVHIAKHFDFSLPPDARAAVADGGGMYLNWDPLVGASQYEIYRDGMPYLSPTLSSLIATIPATGTLSLTDTAALTSDPDALYYQILARDNPGRAFFTFPEMGYLEFLLAIADGLSPAAAVAGSDADNSVQDGTTNYEEAMAHIALELSKELNGGQDPACGCALKAEFDPVAEGITISPCDPVLSDWLEPGPDPGYEPAFPLVGAPPPLSGASWWAWEPPTCVNLPENTTERMEFWCRLEQEIQPSPGTGLPRWESYIPVKNVLQGPLGLEDVKHPTERTPVEKEVMFDSTAFYEIIEHGYADDCALAARQYYCRTVYDFSPWQPPGGLPAFSEGAGIVKTFWLAEAKLPASADPNDYYSYEPPEGERHYLAGMHLMTSTGFDLYPFDWATFWVPKPAGDTTRKDGSSLYYNDKCTVGHKNDQPPEISGVWSNYVMCTQGAPGEANCGNPWGPPNECLEGYIEEFSCDGCHYAVTELVEPVHMLLGRLPTLVDTPDMLLCYDQIAFANEAFDNQLYANLAPAECVD